MPYIYDKNYLSRIECPSIKDYFNKDEALPHESFGKLFHSLNMSPSNIKNIIFKQIVDRMDNDIESFFDFDDDSVSFHSDIFDNFELEAYIFIFFYLSDFKEKFSREKNAYNIKKKLIFLLMS